MKASWFVASRNGLMASMVLLLVVGVGGRPAPPADGPLGVASTPISVPIQDIIAQSSAASADFDGDGDKEIVIGGTDGMLYVVAYSGAAWSLAWSRQVAVDLNAAGAPSGCANTGISDIRSSVAIGDLDNDGDLEIVVATGGSPAYHRNGGILVYTFDSASPWSFSALPGWPQPNTDELGSGSGIRNPDGCWDGIEASPAIGDLDGDGDLEVVISSLNRRIYAWHHDGTLVSSWPIYRYDGDNLLRGGLSSPALADLDGDGLVDVVVGTNSPPWGGEGSPLPDYSKATVWAIKGNSENVPGWPVETKNNVFSSPAIGDIDQDGEPEVVVGSGPSVEGGDGRWVYAWNADDTPVSGWPRPTAGDISAPPALGDLDGDGDLEVVVGCGKEFDTAPSCTYLYAWHGDGLPVAGFPTIPGNFTQPYSPILVDYDGDGSLEVLVVKQLSQAEPWGVGVVENDGTLNPDSTIQVQGILYNSPLIDDLDNDGLLEAVMGGFAVYIWDLPTSANVAQPWPMFHHDRHRTGNLDFNLDTTPPQNPTTLDSPSHVPDTWSNDAEVHVTWSGASDDESGIAGYYYAWDTSPATLVDQTATWLDGSATTVTTALGTGANWYFHIRAVNGARLLAEDALHFGPLKIDAVPPVSQLSAPSCAVLSTAVSWSGSDTGSGIASYDIQVRQGSVGAWENWRSGTVEMQGVYTNTTGYVYQFRSLARDQAGNVEVKGSDVVDAQTWLGQYGFSGTVYNVGDEPVAGAQVTSTPAASWPAQTDMQGDYLLCHEEAGPYALTVSHPRFGALPAMERVSGTAAGLDFYLPPADDGLLNGQFETGDLSDWLTSTLVLGEGTLEMGAVGVTDTSHTGDYGVALSDGGAVTWTAALSQSVFVAETMIDPTLSWVYRLAGGSPAWAAVQGTGQPVTRSLPAAADWTHAWLDLSAFQGQTVTVALHVDGLGGGSGQLIVDEVSLGTLAPGDWRIYLPLVLRWP